MSTLPWKGMKGGEFPQYKQDMLPTTAASQDKLDCNSPMFGGLN